MTETTEIIDMIAPIPRPDHVPLKFWDTEKGEVAVEKLLASYAALEKKLSLNEEPEEDRASLLKRLGCPDCADGYDVAVKDNLFSVDSELNKRLHQKGFTTEQVQEVYDLAVEKFIPLLQDMAIEFQAEREIEKLITHFGGPDRYAQMAKQMLAWGQKNLSSQMLNSLSGSYEGVVTLSRLMQGSDLRVSGGVANPNDPEQDLLKMMRDPRYWEKRDPNFIAKVTQGFEEIYG